MSIIRRNQFRSLFLICMLLTAVESSAFAAAFAPAVSLPAGAGPASIITASFRNTCSTSNIAPGAALTPLTNTALGNPSAATDGDTGNYWYSFQVCGGVNLNAFMVDLGSTRSIGSYTAFPIQTSGFTISTSDDAATWTPQHTQSNTILPGLVGPISIAVNGAYAARYIKYEGSNEAGWCAYTGIADFQIFENCISTAQQDVAVVNFLDDTVSVMLGNGDGTFSRTDFAVGTAPYAVISGDFNGDGNSDLAVANSKSNDITILFGDGAGDFPTAATYSVGTTPYSLTSGDLDGDGFVDIAVANLKSGNISVLIGDGAGNYSATDPAVFPAGSSPDAIVAADFYTDEVDELDLPIVKDELAVADSNGNTVSILSLKKNPDNTYTMTIANKYTVGTTPLALVTGDFNGDGMPDVAAANSNSRSISVLLGMGTNLLTAAVSYAVNEFPASLTTGDLNGDGLTDLAVTHIQGNSLSVLYGNGNGKFQAPLTFPVGDYPLAVAAGDFDADSQTDLLTANYKANALSMLINTPNTGINLTSPAGGEHIHTGDSHLITWDAFPGAVSYAIYFSYDNGIKFKRMAKVGSVTSYNWSVPLPKLPNGNDNLIKIIGYNASKKVVAEGRSKSSFAIEAVSLLTPNGGETVAGGDTLTVSWDTFATKKTPTSAKLSLWDGSSWSEIATLNPIPVSASYDWVLPTVAETRHSYLVKIELKAGSRVVATDVTDGFFTINPAP